MAKKENSAVEKTAVRKKKTAEKAEEKQAAVAPETGLTGAEGTMERKTETAPAVYTAEEVNAMLAEMQAKMEAMQAQLAERTAPVSIFAAAPEERVFFRWQAPVADENKLEIGPNGRWGTVTGKTGAFSVPKSELGSVMSTQFRGLLDRRWLIVLSGLDEEEQEALGVRYRAGEVLDKQAFSNLLKLGMELAPLYKALCPGNREIVEKLVYEKWVATHKAKRDLMEALNRTAKECGRPENAFRMILQEMNAEAAE